MTRDSVGTMVHLEEMAVLEQEVLKEKQETAEYLDPM